MDESVGAPHPSRSSRCICFPSLLEPENAVYSSSMLRGWQSLKYVQQICTNYTFATSPHLVESCFAAFLVCVSFSGAGCGVPLTNILPKAVLPLTDASDIYGARKTTSLSPQASCTEITAKLLLGSLSPPPAPSQNRAKGGERNK